MHADLEAVCNVSPAQQLLPRLVKKSWKLFSALMYAPIAVCVAFIYLILLLILSAIEALAADKMVMQCWQHGPSSSGSLSTTPLGIFKTDHAYLVFKHGSSQVFTWKGTDAPEDFAAAARQHAEKLLAGTRGIKITAVTQGAEPSEFIGLFSHLEYVSPSPGSVPPAPPTQGQQKAAAKPPVESPPAPAAVERQAAVVQPKKAVELTVDDAPQFGSPRASPAKLPKVCPPPPSPPPRHTTLQVFKHGQNSPGLEATSAKGIFETEAAYVVLKPNSSQVYTWRGLQTSAEDAAAAVAHANRLLVGSKLLPVEIMQGQEPEDFIALFPSLEVVTPLVTPPPEAKEVAVAVPKETAVVPKAVAEPAAVAVAVAASPLISPREGAPPPPLQAVLATEAAAAAKKRKKKHKKGKGGTAAAGAGEVASQNAEDEPEKVEIVAEDEEPASEVAEAEAEAVATVAPASPAAPAAAAAAAAPSPQPLSTPPARTFGKFNEGVKPTLAAVMLSRTGSGQAASSPVIQRAKTYMAESAKAWGANTPSPSRKEAAAAAAVTVTRVIPYEELKNMRGDSGIDMTYKEMYLGDEEFVKVFKKDREAFFKQPAWRQNLQKKEVGLW